MRDNQQDSILDLILTNEENMIDNIKYLPPLGKSDHVTIQFSLITYINRFRSRTEKLNFCKGDYEKKRTNLKDIKWEDKITEAMNLQESWESFTDLINNEVKNNIPMCKAFNKKHDTPWMTRASLKAIKKKHTRSELKETPDWAYFYASIWICTPTIYCRGFLTTGLLRRFIFC